MLLSLLVAFKNHESGILGFKFCPVSSGRLGDPGKYILDKKSDMVFSVTHHRLISICWV